MGLSLTRLAKICVGVNIVQAEKYEAIFHIYFVDRGFNDLSYNRQYKPFFSPSDIHLTSETEANATKNMSIRRFNLLQGGKKVYP
jgi:hypothetical protein